MRKESGLILALDVTHKDEAVKIAEEVSHYFDAIKVNYPLILSSGIDIIGRLADLKPVIADLKVADIPYTSSLISQLAFKAGASGIIAHGFTGSDTISAVMESGKPFNGEVYIVSELSSKGGTQFFPAISDKIVEMAIDLGCDGIIAPATRVERIAHYRKMSEELTIISPGVGAQGGEAEAAIKAGADFIILGRSIYRSADPQGAAQDYVNRVKQILKNE
ncbi:MAG: orotidine-5'-phosphate decarboxylase [Halobacteriota archaeon]